MGLNGLESPIGDNDAAIGGARARALYAEADMLKICAALWVGMGAIVVIYIASSGTGSTGASAPAWVYSHY